MTAAARITAPARTVYRGAMTDPARWRAWQPRQGDILVCTPAKSGTTWTQTILTMLVHGGPDLPDKVPVLSPWVDADLGVSTEDVAAGLAAQPGRRVVKTHTPADGFPVWEGVTVIAVYRHPLDIFFSLRKHAANRVDAEADHPMRLPVAKSLSLFLDTAADIANFDRDSVATIARHFAQTALSGRVPGLGLFHYADMRADPRGTVAAMARAAGIDADAALIDAVTEATGFAAMKSRAADFAPVGGTGYWKSDAGFFDSATSDKWQGQLPDADLGLYAERLAAVLPEAAARAWLARGAASWPPP